ncbi:M23 family metallopeptidase [Paenisporosarcina sp. OV554]|uniref:M23 family metallopeptidase n=1 Tax=Paenisporosarcina sp. OV554 TaxID=2135694 RepID=UPI000D44878A|nr:M23 family metallopeptidase [Paenisporosarcina sp. OV554]PUB08232.1 peptidase M23-like protein [Paenisporosarcina sp. OV554]
MFQSLRYPIFLVLSFFALASVATAESEQSKEQLLIQRMGYYQQYSNPSVPWYFLAAVDKYERNIQQVRNDLKKREGPIALQFSDAFWVGDLNPVKNDRLSSAISFFGGNGMDGSGDGKADLENNDDLMLTLSNYLIKYGHSENDFKKALKDYYVRDEAVRQIMIIAQIYQHFETLDLDQHAFPLPVGNDYSYRSTWGSSRGWGGRRMHEGTDLYASYGVPVRSTTYGVIEVMGWNDFGGWRIGIRDIHNTYHYFAHLSHFNKGVKEGHIVEPGMIIGYVGSSGYGKKGTSGKFPPHLHYGMYKFNGRIEWAYDPFPSLKHWEIEDRKAM